MRALIPVPIPVPAPAPVETATSDDVFDSSVLHDLHLTVNAADLDSLRTHFGENTFYPADLKWKQTTVRNVAIRSRGTGSRSGTKPGLYIDINRLTPGQTFVGLKGLVLDNLLQDPAMMREALAMSIFARMSLPAPRVAFYRLYLNDQYEGLYLLIENIDKPFLNRTFGRDDGYLFEHHLTQRFDGEYIGDDLSAYRSLFEARTNSGESDSALYEPIRALFEAVNAPEEIKGRAELDALLDLRQFVRLLAVEKVMMEMDGLAGRWGMHNFYLYRDKNAGVHSFVVWDRDRAFGEYLLWGSIFDGTADNRLAQRALGYGDLHDLFVQTAEDTANLMRNNGWLSSELERFWTLIREAAYADTHKPYSNEEIDGDIESLREMVRDRPDVVLRETGAMRTGANR
ncbi:MAG TPA: CotH kinase family protein [Vicinamibacterales bacterium]|nr:CotH kinase family protein [Vicinamibacterales bacterium]